MFKSVITIKCYLDRYFGSEREKYSWTWLEEMLIPQIIGNIKIGFKNAFRFLKLLPLGGRYRGDVGTC